MTPEDLDQIRQIVAESEAHTVEAMRDMQSEILCGLEWFARGNFARLVRVEAR